MAQLRQHKQRLNDLTAEDAARLMVMEFILLLLLISANEAKTQEEELMQQRTMSHVEQLRT